MPGRDTAVRSTAILLVACWPIAGCGASPGPSRGLSSTRYVLCTSAVGNCRESTMRTEPHVMYLSGDGSLYAVRITWIHWGAATAIGKGTAEVNDCTPSCAEGTVHAHSATITVSDLRAWRGSLAYTRVSVSVPASSYSYTFTRGLIPAAAPSTTPVPAPPSPSSTAAALLSTSCTMGLTTTGR